MKGRLSLEVPAFAGSLSPTGRDVALLTFHGLQIRDLEDPERKPWVIPSDAPGMPTSVQWHSSIQKPSTLLSGSGSTVLLWDLTTQASHSTALNGHERAITDVDASSISPELTASSSVEGIISMWDLRDGRRPSQQLYVEAETVRSVKLSPVDANLVASTHGTKFRVWDLRKWNDPLCTVEAHPYTVGDIRWHSQVRERLTTCASDKTVKFWNFGRATSRQSGNDAADPLDRVLQTDTPITSTHYMPSGEAVMAFGDELMLLDCRVRRISDRKAKVTPTKTWPFRRSKAVGIRYSKKSGMQCLALSEGRLQTAELSEDVLKDVGVTAPVTSNNALDDHAEPQSILRESLGQSDGSESRYERTMRQHEGYAGIYQSESEHRRKNSQSEQLETDGAAKRSSELSTIPDSLDADQMLTADDEDDDFAVIAGEDPTSPFAASKPAFNLPKRLSGATFAPNGSLVRFKPLHSSHASDGQRHRRQDFRGISAYMAASGHADSYSDGDSDADLNLSMVPLDSLGMLPNRYVDRGLKERVGSSFEKSKHDQVEEQSNEVSIARSSVVAVHELEDLLSSKKILAEAYTLSGSPYEICQHNQEVCEANGYDDHAVAWEHLALLLKPVVPVEPSDEVEEENVIARRNLVEIKRRDGRGNAIGTTYAFDEPSGVTNPAHRAPVLWANHPFGRTFVRKMFRMFRAMGDIQMLAMMSVVLAIDTPRYTSARSAEVIQSGPVKISYKNKEKFDAGRKVNQKRSGLLDHRDADMHRKWRQNYADQLYAWGLPFARAEILQMNAPDPAQEAKDLSQMPLDLRSSEKSKSDVQLQCSICWEIVEGYSVVCSDCEHASHPACLNVLLQTLEESDASCMVGCGCVCTEVNTEES